MNSEEVQAPYARLRIRDRSSTDRHRADVRAFPACARAQMRKDSALSSVGNDFGTRRSRSLYAADRARPCIANFESPPIALARTFHQSGVSALRLRDGPSLASPTGSGTHVSTTLAKLSTNANKACCARPSGITRTCSMLAGSRCSALAGFSSCPDNFCSLRGG
jgi:hypothetical protein